MWKRVILALALYIITPASASDTPRFVRINEKAVVCDNEAALRQHLTKPAETPAVASLGSTAGPECRLLSTNTVYAVLSISFLALDSELVVIGQLYLWPKGTESIVFGVLAQGSIEELEEI